MNSGEDYEMNNWNEFFPETGRTFECADNLKNDFDFCIDYYDEYIEIDGVIVNKAEWEKTNKIKKEEPESNMAEMDAETIDTSCPLQHGDRSPMKSRDQIQSNISGATKNTGKSFECDKGEHKTKTVQLKEEHNNSVLNKRFKCHYCDYITKEKSYLTRHEKRLHLPDHRIKRFECEHCDYKTKAKADLKSHMNVHTPDDQIKWFQCDQCVFKAKAKAHLKEHQKLKHLPEDSIEWYECGHCEFKTKYKSYVKKHRKLKHLPDDRIEWFKCDHCHFKTKSKCNLKTHMILHTPDDQVKWFQCDHCLYRTKHKFYLIEHQKRKHLPSDDHILKMARV